VHGRPQGLVLDDLYMLAETTRWERATVVVMRRRKALRCVQSFVCTEDSYSYVCRMIGLGRESVRRATAVKEE